MVSGPGLDSSPGPDAGPAGDYQTGVKNCRPGQKYSEEANWSYC